MRIKIITRYQHVEGANCRTNRPYGQEKTHGLIVDYIGVFDDVAQAIQFDEEGMVRVVSNIAELKAKLPEAVHRSASPTSLAWTVRLTATKA